MEELAIYLLKSAGVLSVFVLIYHFLLRRLTFFQANRWFLLFGLVASVVFPLIEITQTVYVEQPVFNQEQIIYTPTAYVVQKQTAIPEESWFTTFDFQTLLYAIYAMFALFFVGKMTLELASLYRLIRSGDLFRSDRFLLVSLSRKLTPFSFFKYICYTRGDDKEPQFQAILNHEKVHARQYHSMDILIAVVYRALFWFNPLSWLVKRQITENLEFIADSQAKSSHTSSISYERTLLSVMSCPQQPALANNFFTPFIKERILMLQKETSARWHAYKYALILPIIVVFLYSFNVVEEIKYVEPADKTDLNELMSKDQEQNVFKIPSSASIDEINAIAQQISESNSYSLEVLDTERLKGLISNIDLQVIFAEQPDNVHRFSMGHDNESLKDILIYTDTDRLNLSEVDGYMSFDVSRDKGIDLKLTENGKAAQELEPLSVDYSSDQEKMGPDPLHIMGTKQVLQSEFKEGSKITSERMVMYYPKEATKRYGDKAKDGAFVHEGKTTLTDAPVVSKKDEVLIIKISSKTTQKQLDEKVAKLAEYKVDFKIKKSKFKDGKLVKFHFELDDKKGYKTSIKDETSDGIKDICITRLDQNNRVEWKVDRCENAAMTFLTNNYINDATVTLSGMDVEEMKARLNKMGEHLKDNDTLTAQEYEIMKQQIALKSHQAALKNHDKAVSNHQVALQSHQAALKNHEKALKNHQYNLTKVDTVFPRLISQKMQLDSISSMIDSKKLTYSKTQMETHKKKIASNLAALKKAREEFTKDVPNSKSIYTLGEVYYDGKLIREADPLPIYVVNGIQMTVEEYSLIPKDKFISSKVIHGQEALEKYGEKAQGGVFEITMQDDFKWNSSTTNSNNTFSSASEITNGTVTYSESVSIDKVVFIDFTREELEKYRDLVTAQGHEFKIRTFRTKGDKVVKLKIDFAGSSYTIVAANKIESITFQYYEDGRKPIMTSISR
jgi:hypothetical protein